MTALNAPTFYPAMVTDGLDELGVCANLPPDMFTDGLDGLGLGVDDMGCIFQDGWVGDYSGSNSPGYHCRCKHGGDRSGYWRESGVGIIQTLVPDDEGDGGEGGGSHEQAKKVRE